jgi:hypothetical protein
LWSPGFDGGSPLTLSTFIDALKDGGTAHLRLLDPGLYIPRSDTKEYEKEFFARVLVRKDRTTRDWGGRISEVSRLLDWLSRCAFARCACISQLSNFTEHARVNLRSFPAKRSLKVSSARVCP